MGYYECDPKKNTECNKLICDKPCHLTTNKAFAKEVKEEIENKNGERKEAAVLKGGSVLPDEVMARQEEKDINP